MDQRCWTSGKGCIARRVVIDQGPSTVATELGPSFVVVAAMLLHCRKDLLHLTLVELKLVHRRALQSLELE